MIHKASLILVLNLYILNALAQYAPAAGIAGSNAIYKDSSIILGWATQCNVQRGWQNIADTSMGKASYGTQANALGKADNSTISLGDRGTAILQFQKPISDGPLWDFVVFENAFNDEFLELAFVEVSSDGINYVRFPAHSLTQVDSQVTTFATLNPIKINNLAGKYKVGYGTPFDLHDLSDSANIDFQNINYIKLIDVVGSIDTTYASFDSNGNIINDPFPTPFPSSGFDLDAIGYLHTSVGEKNRPKAQIKYSVFPNPCANKLTIKINNDAQIIVYDPLSHPLINTHSSSGRVTIDVSSLKKGLYFLRIITKTQNYTQGFIKLY